MRQRQVPPEHVVPEGHSCDVAQTMFAQSAVTLDAVLSAQQDAQMRAAIGGNGSAYVQQGAAPAVHALVGAAVLSHVIVNDP